MELGIIVLVIIGGLLLFIEIDKLKKQVKSQQKQIDTLCEQTGNNQLATYHISDEDKELILHLKNSGKDVEAVKKSKRDYCYGISRSKTICRLSLKFQFRKLIKNRKIRI